MGEVADRIKYTRDEARRKGDILREASWLYHRGLWVVPCADKKPIWAGWQAARRGAEELLDALDGGGLNIGLVLNQSPWIDLEYDGAGGEDRVTALFAGNIPPTPTWDSPRGRHRLFLRPSGLPEKAKLDLDDIEFRLGNGKGALTIVPPSLGRRWLPGLSLRELEPAELPEEVVARFRAPAPRASAEPAGDGTIPEGKRNDTLFQKACALRDLKLPEATILTTLLDLNQKLCKPRLSEEEVRGIAASVAKDESKAKGFVGWLLGEIELWHDENDEPFMTLTQDDHKENWKIGSRSRPFRRWLSKRYYEMTGGVLTAGELGDAAALLEGKAVFDGPRYPLFRRTAEFGGKLYFDLCDEKWRAVEIGAHGWQVVSDPPVKFYRAKAMQALPEPTVSKYPLADLLLPFLNVKLSQWPLVAVWLAAALRAVGPYALLKLLGEQGSAKTTTARVLRALIDPNAAPVRAEPREPRDLMISANNGWVLCFDNLSAIRQELSDALCRMSTGGGFSTRTLYTDEDETIFDARRPVILTSIEEIGTRSDLLERSLIIELPTIREGARRAEKTFWADFERACPAILGALLDVVCGAMRRLPEIERKADANLSRMADFEQWGQAAEEPLGLEPGTFAEAYAANREAATHVALESSPVVASLLKFLEHVIAGKVSQEEHTAADLLKQLDEANYEARRAHGWPKAPHVLSAILKRVAPNLRQVGIVATQDTRGGGNAKVKVWRFRKAGAPDPESPAAPTEAKPAVVSALKPSNRLAAANKVGPLESDPTDPSDPTRNGQAHPAPI